MCGSQQLEIMSACIAMRHAARCGVVTCLYAWLDVAGHVSETAAMQRSGDVAAGYEESVAGQTLADASSEADAHSEGESPTSALHAAGKPTSTSCRLIME